MGLSLGDLLKIGANFLLPGEPFGGGNGGFDPSTARQFLPEPGVGIPGLPYYLDPFEDPPSNGTTTQPTNGDCGNSAPGPGGTSIPISVAGTVKARHTCPPGYVTVKCPSTGVKSCMLRPVAVRLGLYKPRRKPLITAAEAKSLRQAERLQKKIKRINKVAGMRVPSKPRK